MYYYRMVKYYKKKRTYRKKRTYKRKMRIPRRLPKDGTVLIKRTAWQFNWTLGTATTTDFWKYQGFNLQQLPSWAEITNLWDRYRIAGVKVTFRPRYDSFAGNDTTDTTTPGITNLQGSYVHIINDPYSAVTPSGTYNTTTLNSFLEQGNVRSYQGTRPFSFYVKPTVDVTLNGVAQARRAKAPFVNTTQANFAHYGYHAFQQDINMTGASGQSFDIFYTFYIVCTKLR